MDLDDREQVSEMLDLISQAAEDAMPPGGDILDYTRQSSIEKRPIRVEEFLERVRRKTHEVVTLGKVDLSIQCERGLAVLGDARKLERVFINLIVNATEALVAHRSLDRTILLAARTVEGKVLIDVSDNGPGIPLRIRTKLFEPFVTQGKANGTGLGLAIAKQIVECTGAFYPSGPGLKGRRSSSRSPDPKRRGHGLEKLGCWYDELEIPYMTSERAGDLGRPAQEHSTVRPPGQDHPRPAPRA